jgi:hypothetical protein
MTDQQRAEKIAALLSMPLAELVAHVTTCRSRELHRIDRLGMVCRCEPFSDVYRGRSAADRARVAARLGIMPGGHDLGWVCGKRFVLCSHSELEALPAEAAAVLMARLWPEEYRGRAFG